MNRPLIHLLALLIAGHLSVVQAQTPPVSGPERPAYPPPGLGPRIAAERASNEDCLRSESTRARLAGAPRDAYVAIWGGDEVAVGASLTALLAGIEERSRAALHRFLFRVDSAGDVTETTTFDYSPVVGNAFLNAVPFAIGLGEPEWNAIGPKGPVKFPAEPGTGRAILPVRIGEPGDPAAEDADFLVATGFGGTMILPTGMHLPRCEIPGIARVTAATAAESAPANDRARRFRRCLVRTRITAFGTDTVLAVLGEEITPWMHPDPLPVGRSLVPPYGLAVLNAARRAGQPILLFLAGDPAGLPADLFDDPAVQTALHAFTLARGRYGGSDPLLAGLQLNSANGWKEDDAGAIVVVLHPRPNALGGPFAWVNSGPALVLRADLKPADLVRFLAENHDLPGRPGKGK